MLVPFYLLWWCLAPYGAPQLEQQPCRRGKVCLTVRTGTSCQSEREEEERKKKGKKKALNGKTELAACSQCVPYRLQEAAGAAVEGRRGAAGWGLPAHQLAAEVCGYMGHEEWATVTLQQPAAQVGWAHGLRGVNKFLSHLGTLGLFCCGAEKGAYRIMFRVWHSCGDGGRRNWFRGLLLQEDTQNFRFSGRIFVHGGVCERTSLGAIQEQQTTFRRCKSTISYKAGGRKGNICSGQGSA